MTPLEEAWEWYKAARGSLRRIERLGTKYWDELPWEGKLGRDNLLGQVLADEASRDAAVAQSPLDDLAIILMFSAFEAMVRQRVAEQVQREVVALQHPVLVAAARTAVDAIQRRAFSQVLDSYSAGGHAGLVEQVRQVRQYRNWVAHGRRGKALATVDPKSAYDRLTDFLDFITPSAPPAEELPGGEPD